MIDDDRTVLAIGPAGVGREAQSELLTAGSAAEGMELMKSESPDLLLLDIMLPDGRGIELVNEIREFDIKLPVIFITGVEDSGLAIEAMKRGAYEFVVKPLSVEQIQDLVERGLHTRRLMLAPVRLQEGEELPADGDILVGRSPQMLEVYKQIGRVAGQDVAVLIRGESGTGKELVARAIYQHSHRSDNCFLAVNCAALSDTLLESELFGHEKGAFTGADRQHIGKFEQCNDGTIFLDEVGDMSPLTQSKVLRVLQEKKFERVGGRETIEVDVRIISATNRDLEQMIADGEFRLDLYHRLNTFEIFLPPLRERGDDLRLLIQYFLQRFNRELGKQVTAIADEAMDLLLSYRWPGNIRELQGALRKAMLMATGPILLPECLPEKIRQPHGSPASSTAEHHPNPETDIASFVDGREAANSKDIYAETLEWMERYLLSRILRKHHGNQSKAATELGITRGSLRHKMKTLGIAVDNVVRDAEDEED
ncbi:MAG: nitrogen assimilation regulatory protein [Pirellulaceae bacterium]|nr:MAG: nitrogen assimilation regulatory protein [Pirellulaceae bacterium]